MKLEVVLGPCRLGRPGPLMPRVTRCTARQHIFIPCQSKHGAVIICGYFLYIQVIVSVRRDFYAWKIKDNYFLNDFIMVVN
jgi:hypothetical protein